MRGNGSKMGGDENDTRAAWNVWARRPWLWRGYNRSRKKTVHMKGGTEPKGVVEVVAGVVVVNGR